MTAEELAMIIDTNYSDIPENVRTYLLSFDDAQKAYDILSYCNGEFDELSREISHAEATRSNEQDYEES